MSLDKTPSTKDHSLPSPRYFIQSLEKGLNVLQAFNQDHPAMTLTELSAVLGQPKAGTQRIVRTLKDLGFLQMLPGKRYSLGVMALDLGHRFLTTLDLPALAEPFLQELVKRTQETVNLAIRSGREVVYVARIAAAPRILSVNLEVGARLPAHATALGKALLLDCAVDQLEAWIGPSPWADYTASTKTTPEALYANLAEARTSDIVLNDGELEPGLRSIAAPVRDLSGRICAAINVSTNASRISLEELLGPMSDALKECASQVSAALGYRRT